MKNGTALINSLLESGFSAEAIEKINEQIEKNGGSRGSWLKLGAISLREKDYNSGIVPFLKLTHINPEDPIASSGLVQCLHESNLYDLVEKEILRFRRICSKSDIEDEAVIAVLREHEELLDTMKGG